MSLMNMGILGGSFDPVHTGHIHIARYVLTHTEIETILLMPCYKHAFNKSISPAQHRLQMLYLVEQKNIEVSNYEIQKRTTNYTYDTLCALQRQYPHDTLFWIIGSDQLESFQKWKNWQKIVTQFGLVIFPRNMTGENMTRAVKKYLHITTIPQNIKLIIPDELALNTVSSTEIRKNIRDGKSISKIVHKEVEEYIKEHNVYT